MGRQRRFSSVTGGGGGGVKGWETKLKTIQGGEKKKKGKTPILIKTHFFRCFIQYKSDKSLHIIDDINYAVRTLRSNIARKFNTTVMRTH